MTTDTRPGAWDAALLARIADVHEVVIETIRAAGDARRTIIWVVADDRAAYVRSVRGDDGWWYRDIVARPTATLDLGGERVAVRATPATDPESVAHVSELLRAKYHRQAASTAAMLQPHTLHTTLRLDPS